MEKFCGEGKITQLQGKRKEAIEAKDIADGLAKAKDETIERHEQE